MGLSAIMSQPFVDAQILLYPRGKIPRRVSAGFVVSDVYSSMTGSGISDGTGGLPDPYSDLNPTTAAAWGQNPYTLSIDGCQFVRFYADGQAVFGASIPRDPKNELAGFYLTPRYAALDSRVGANASTVPGTKTTITWTAVKGKWNTHKAIDADAGTGIQNCGGEAVAVARTLGTLPANRGFRVRLQLTVLPNQSALPSQRIRWGETWAVRLLHGKVPRVERLLTTSAVVNGQVVTTSEWKIVKELAGAKPVNVRGGKCQLFIMRIAGRLVVVYNGLAWWFLDTGTNGKAKPKDVNWGAASVWLESAGVRLMRADIATIKWCAPDGQPYEGSVERVIPRQTDLDENSSATGSSAGWKYAGTKQGTVFSLVDGGVKYILNLKANADGIDTPFTDKVTARFQTVWVNPNPTPKDVRHATRAVGISLEMSGQVTANEATIELDRTLLDEFGGNWEPYALMDNPVEIFLKRAGQVFVKVFSGYIIKPERTSDASGNRILKLTCRDPLVRLQKVGDVYNAIVDHRCMALDLLFAEQLSASFSNGGYNSDGTPAAAYEGLYFADCFKAVVELFLGHEEAARINGDGNARKFYGRDHLPILSPGNDLGGWVQMNALAGEPIAAGGFLLPPPYWEDACTWLKQIADKDRCTFFYGWPPGFENDAPCLVYGRLPRILRSSGLRVHTLRDVVVNGSRQGLLNMVSVERRAERTFNRLIVAGPDEPGLAGLRPSLSIDEFNLENHEGDAAWRSWEKTFLVREPLAFLAGKAIGEGLIQLMQGVNLQWPTFGIEAGDERIGVGHLVKVDFSQELSKVGRFPDTSLGLGGQLFRVENVTHDCVFTETGGLMSTTVRPRPLNAEEERAYNHVVNIGGINETEPEEVEVEIPV